MVRALVCMNCCDTIRNTFQKAAEETEKNGFCAGQTAFYDLVTTLQNYITQLNIQFKGTGF